MSYKLKRDGWVWKLHQEFYSEVFNKLVNNEPVGICLLFWNTLFQMLKFVGMGLSIVALVGVIIFVIWTVVINTVLALVTACFEVFLSFVNYDLAVCVLTLFFITTFGFILIELFLKAIGSSAGNLEIAPKYITKHFEVKEKKVKSNSLVKSYWKSFKEKICPYVELDNDI